MGRNKKIIKYIFPAIGLLAVLLTVLNLYLSNRLERYLKVELSRRTAEATDGFYNLSFDFNNNMGTVIEQIADELSVFMRTHIPEHLMNEYQIYTGLIAGIRILAKIIEECINEDLLVAPENKIGAEGVLMIVEK